MKRLHIFWLVFGLLLLVLLLIWQGLMDIFRLLFNSGWQLLWLPLAWLPNILPATESWRVLFDGSRRPSYLNALLAMWAGRSVNNLLPVATIGGEVVKARLLTLWGADMVQALASVVVDKTVQVIALLVWGLAGTGLLFASSLNDPLALAILGGFAALAIAVSGFFMAQKAGIFRILANLGEKLMDSANWEGINLHANSIDVTVMEIYKRRYAFLYSCLLRVLSLVLQTAEIWLACYLLGHPVDVPQALLLKSLTSTISDIAFMIPNAYGIQEGAFIMVGALLGFNPEFALAVSLAIRVREVIIDLPGLLYWHYLEGKFWIKQGATD